MNKNCNSDEHCEDEIFFGKLTLKEFKKHVSWNKGPRQQHKHTSIAKRKLSKSLDSDKTGLENDICNDSLKIIESHSEPNLMRDSVANISLDTVATDNDDSFITMENMVAQLCVTPAADGSNEKLNNTLEVIEYILKYGPKEQDNNVKVELKDEKTNNIELLDEHKEMKEVSDENKYIMPPAFVNTCNSAQPALIDYNTIDPQCILQSVTPVKKNVLHNNKLASPFREKTPKTPIFKTPVCQSIKKSPATSSRKFHAKSNTYQHISSPVASYIKNTPKVSLVKDIRPKTPLQVTSHIPVIVKSHPKVKSNNKENVNLPAVAYKHAKITKVIKLEDEKKLPQSQWVDKITSLSKPVVVKHHPRELNLINNEAKCQQEESFADLPCHQAEVSVCTQKTAFKHK